MARKVTLRTTLCSLLRFLLSAPSLLFALCSPLSTILPARQGRPAIRRPALGSEAPARGPASAPTPMAPPNDLFQEFMRTYIEKVQDQAPAAPAALIAEAGDDTDRPLKPRNPDLYYGNSNMECYYFCQQCEEHFEVAGSLGHKRVPFAAGFLKDRILNW